MSQLRLNPFNGRWVTIATERATRPDEFARPPLPVEADPSRPCPFCPGNEEDTPPALETYGPEGHWLVRVVPNRYPAFSGTAPMTVTNLGPVFRQAPASGLHEVLVLSPDHEATLPDLDDEQLRVIMAAVRDRLAEHAGTGVRYSQAIINHGREAGASLRHPHGQLLAIPFVPGEIAEEEAAFRRFQGSCVVCTTIEAELDAKYRVVADDDRATIVCPFWSGIPYEMLAMPKAHVGHAAEADLDDLVAVARLIRDSLAKLVERVDDLAYSLVLHTLPHHHHNEFHWHIHVLPRVASVVGFEQGTGVLINIVAPEAAAELLR
jgi:UDPglucose--hexose-1-phosphate uridylyltransferase